MKDTLLIELQYLPCQEYFYHIINHSNVYIESCESFQKQSFRNRCHVLGANKVEALTIPVIHKGAGTLIRDTEIDYNQRWLNIHLRTLESAYRKAPYFQFYWDYFENIFVKRNRFLFDLNLELMTVCLKLLGIEKKIELTSDYFREVSQEINDFRSIIHPKKVNRQQIIILPTYTQLFGSNFVPNLSIIDLLFNAGPDSIKLLEQGKCRSI